jgi:hypothetical protein
MFTKKQVRLLLVATLCTQAYGANVIINGDFEAFSISSGNYNNPYVAGTNPDGYLVTFGNDIRAYDAGATSMGWKTTSTNNGIELWKSATGGGANSPSGTGQYAELNYTENAALFQDVTISLEGLVDYGFDHSARNRGTDTMKVLITYLGSDGVFGGGNDVVVVDTNFSSERLGDRTTENVWAPIAVNDAFTSVAGGVYRFSFGAVSTAPNTNTDSPLSEGNFIDNIVFGINAVPEPSSALLGAFGALALLRRRRN